MIFQYIYVFNALILYSLLDGTNQVFCKKKRYGRRGRHGRRYAENDYFGVDEGLLLVDFNYRTDPEDLPLSQNGKLRRQYPRLIYDEDFNPKKSEPLIYPEKLKDLSVLNDSSKISARDKNREDRIPKQNNKFYEEKIKSKSSTEENKKPPKFNKNKVIKLNEKNIKSKSSSEETKKPSSSNEKKVIKYNEKNIKSKSSSEETKKPPSSNKKKVIKFNEKNIKFKSSSEETKKPPSSNEKKVMKYNEKKKRHKATHLRQILDVETLLNNPNILKEPKPKEHEHHLRPSQEELNDIKTTTTAEGNNYQTNPDNTDQPKSSVTGHGAGAGVINVTLDNYETLPTIVLGIDNGSHGSTEPSDQSGSGTKQSSQDVGDSQSTSSNNCTAKLPTLPTLNVFSDNSSVSCNTHPGYGEDYIYMLLEATGKAERHDLTCHPKIKLGNEMKTAPDKIKIKLYTRKNRDDPEILGNVQNANLKLRFKSTLQSLNFGKNKDLKVVTHGHTNPAETLQFIEDIKDAYLDEFDVNVIIVDWKQVSDSPYMLMARLYESVSMVLGNLLDALIKTFKYKKSIHLIGHGVGAHLMGYVSKFTQHQIYRITGLDPERPYFERPPSRTHALKKGDATFVDIIHTSKGIRGYAKSHGDVDFYPNEGITPQPNCTGNTHTILEEICSHFLALFYFRESISTKDGFTACHCMVGACKPGKAAMGEYATSKDQGDFYLKTNSEQPYARGNIDC